MQEFDLTETYTVLNVPLLYLLFNTDDMTFKEEGMWVELDLHQYNTFCTAIGGEHNAIFFRKDETYH